jgi:hypothetical protein
VVRRRVHRCAVAACGLFAGIAAVALVRPGRYAVGPVVVRLQSVVNPLVELGMAFLVARATSKGVTSAWREAARRLALLWSGSSTGSRLFALVLTAKVAVTGLDLLLLPGRVLPSGSGPGTGVEAPLEEVFKLPSRYDQFERFFEQCGRELPADARVLYVGRAEGQLLAYHLYPRPVFMHPDDLRSAWIGHQLLDLGFPLPADPLFPSSLPPPAEARRLRAFVADRRITHEVRFVESDLPACRIGPIR